MLKIKRSPRVRNSREIVHNDCIYCELAEELGIKHKFTSNDISRYENEFIVPNVIWQPEVIEDRGGFELFVYSEPMLNKECNGSEDDFIEDGIHVQIINHQGKDYLLNGCTTKPVKERYQMNIATLYNDIDDAYAAMLDYIKEARIFCNKRKGRV